MSAANRANVTDQQIEIAILRMEHSVPARVTDQQFGVARDWRNRQQAAIDADDSARWLQAWGAAERCWRWQADKDEAAAIEAGLPFCWWWHPERLDEIGKDVVDRFQPQFLREYEKSQQPAKQQELKAFRFPNNLQETPNAALVASRCAVMTRSYETGGAGDSEPLWWALIRCAAHMAPDISVELSDGHAKYDPNELQARMERIEREGLKPATCLYISDSSPECSTCEWRGVIKSPVALGFDHLPSRKGGQHERTDETQHK